MGGVHVATTRLKLIMGITISPAPRWKLVKRLKEGTTEGDDGRLLVKTTAS